MSVLDRYKNGWIEDDSLFVFLRSLANIEIGGNRMYDGSGNHFMQNPIEFHNLLEFLVKAKFQFGLKFDNFLEFGWSTGICHSILYKVLDLKESVAVDIASPSGMNTNTFFANLRFKNLTFIANDSTSNFTREKISKLGPFDLIFIDGGHDYETASSDLDLALKNISDKGLIVLHDIHAQKPSEVDMVWRKINENRNYQTREFVDLHSTIRYGIGVLIPNSLESLEKITITSFNE
jgi:predicted O-methyltransferase YrrM